LRLVNLKIQIKDQRLIKENPTTRLFSYFEKLNASRVVLISTNLVPFEICFSPVFTRRWIPFEQTNKLPVLCIREFQKTADTNKL